MKDIIVGAHYGLKDWLIQRISAVVMAAYTVVFLILHATPIGRRMRAVNFLTKTDTEVEIVSPHFFDPEGERLRG